MEWVEASVIGIIIGWFVSHDKASTITTTPPTIRCDGGNASFRG
jgi:hypothetical protein